MGDPSHPAPPTWHSPSSLPLGTEPFSSIHESLTISSRDLLGRAIFCTCGETRRDSSCFSCAKVLSGDESLRKNEKQSAIITQVYILVRNDNSHAWAAAVLKALLKVALTGELDNAPSAYASGPIASKQVRSP